MSYEPLHHKYRPQTFADLVGQEAIATTLTSALEQNKIAPAYLFTGPRGTGKTSSARILAKSLNCLSSDRPTPNPCGKCEVCQAIARGLALDVMEIDAASNTGVDNIREIIERCQFAPVQSRYKVYAIDECHMLSTAAFNALLKTLEEPPDRVIFVLATTDPQRVLSTIISRCQRFDFRRIPLAAMVSHLKYIATQEKIKITKEAITLVAQIANGGLRDAESLLDQLSLLPEIITIEQVWDLVGSVPEQDLLTLLKAIAANRPEEVIDQCRNLLDRGREPLVVLQNLAGFYLNLLIAKTAPNRPDLTVVTETTWHHLCTHAQHWEIGEILRGQQQLKDAEVQLKNTTQPRLWLEVTLLGLLPLSLEESRKDKSDRGVREDREDKVVSSPTMQVKSPENYLVNSSRHSEPIPSNQLTSSSQNLTSTPTNSVTTLVENGINSNPVQTKHALSLQTPNSLNISPQELWKKAIDHLQPPTTQALFRQKCHLIAIEGSMVRVGISTPQLLKLNQGKIPNLEAAFIKACQQTIKVKLEVSVVDTHPEEAISASSQLPTAPKSPGSEPIPTTSATSSVKSPESNDSEKKTLPPTIQPSQQKIKLDANSPVTYQPKTTKEKGEEQEQKQDLDQIPKQTKLSVSDSSQLKSDLEQVNISAETIIQDHHSPDCDDNLAKVIEILTQNFEGEIVTLGSAINEETELIDSQESELNNTLEQTNNNNFDNSQKLAEENIEISKENNYITNKDKLDSPSVKPQTIVRNRPDLSEYEDDDDVPF